MCGRCRVSGPNLTVVGSPDEQKPKLNETDREHLKKTSGLSDTTIDLAGFVSLSKKGAAKVLGRKSYHSAGIAIPFYLPGSEKPACYRVRPDTPRTFKKRNGEESVAKYDQEKGTQPLVYFPPRTCSERLQFNDNCVITEGEKKGCAVDQLGYATVALTGVWNGHDVRHKKDMGEWRLHPWIREYVRTHDRTFILLFDADAATNDNVRKALQRLVVMLYEAGAACVKIATIPPTDADAKRGADDVLAAEGEEALHTIIRGAVKQDRPEKRERRNTPEILVSLNEQSTNNAVVKALVPVPGLFQRAKQLVQIHEPKNQFGEPPRIAPNAIPTTREIISGAVRFYSYNIKTGDQEYKRTPEWCVKAVHARGDWPGIPHLAGLITTPVMRPDGSVLDVPGYDKATGLLYKPSKTIEPVPDEPMSDDVQGAIGLHLKLLQHFPFKEPSDRGTAIAAILTPFARPTYLGPTAPLFWFDATHAGTGKTLLATGIARIVSGGHAPRFLGWQRSEADQRKEITSIVREGASAILLDNIRGEFGSTTIEQGVSLPDGIWSDRVLGGNEMWTGPLHATWLATSNNAQLGGDMRRRVCICRLESDTASPETRTDLPPFIRTVSEQLGPLIRAALVILRAWFVAGRPCQKLPELGSYEGWTAVVRQVVVWLQTEFDAPLADPELSRLRDVNTIHPDQSARGVLLWELHRFLSVHGGQNHELKAGEIARRLAGDVTEATSRGFEQWAELNEALNSLIEGRCNARTLGGLLGSLRDSWHAVPGDAVSEDSEKWEARVRARTLKGLTLWRVELREEADFAD